MKSRPVFAPKVSKEVYSMNGATIFLKNLYQNNRILGNGGPSKKSVLCITLDFLCEPYLTVLATVLQDTNIVF